MFPVLIDYATPSVFESDRERQLLGLAANARRPVRFRARVVREVLPFRLMLQTLGELVWSDDSWLSNEEHQFRVLDPVVTVHPDRVFFEAFSQDQSAYGLVIADRALFETEGEVRTGTTNIDFTGWLWAALGEMRSSRQTELNIDAAGVEVKTTGAGGRFEAKVDLPDSWVRGFLQLQGAMALPGTRVHCRPVDILAPIRFLRYTKANVAPRALRYEFPPDEPVRVVVEPFEEMFVLKASEHAYDELRTVRTWGRRRLKLIEPLLPYADSATVYLKGRALPSFYAVKIGSLTFVLGLTGWTAQRFTDSGSFDLLVDDDSAVDENTATRAHEQLRSAVHTSVRAMAEALEVEPREASRLCAVLCRRGLAIYDVESRSYRHRELFEEPIDESVLYPPDPRREAAQRLLAAAAVDITSCEVRETKKVKKLKTEGGKTRREVIYRDWHVVGNTAAIDGLDAAHCEVVVGDLGRIVFGTCSCPFFQENLLNRGPCEHMLALFQKSEELRTDRPSSRAATDDEQEATT